LFSVFLIRSHLRVQRQGGSVAMCDRDREDNTGQSNCAMLARVTTALVAFLLAGMVPLHGQDQPTNAAAPGPIATDRPAITNSSVVVPAGTFQMENGFLETSSQGQTIVDGQSLVRFGVAKRTELRFTVPDYFYNLNGTGSSGSGFGDFAVGVKEQLGPRPGGFDVSVILFLDRRQHRVQRRIRWRVAGSVVARAVRQMDDGRNVLGVLAHSGPDAKSDRRVHLCVRSASDRTVGCVCRIRRQVSRTRRAAAPAALRNSTKDCQAATD
jgi:hypothetical protein